MAVDANVALVTVTQAKTWLKISGSSEDTLLESFIDRAGDLANRFTGRHLKTKSYTEYYDGNGTAQIILRNHPATTLTSIHIDAMRAWGSESAVDVSADVMLDGAAGIIRLWNNGGLFTKGRGNVRVIYVAGYKDSANNLVPYDLQEAALLIVAHSYKRHYQEQRIGLQSETIADRTFNYSDEAIPKKAEAILKRYRFFPGDRGHV